MTNTPVPGLIAHRGYPSRFPENTLMGVGAAVRVGACQVEVDVQLTADGVPVLYHDEDMSDVSGVDRLVTETTYEQLGQYTAGEPERFGDQFDNLRISSLEAFCETVAYWPELRIFVEIKNQSIDRFGVDAVVAAVVGQTAPIAGRCAIISFHEAALERVRETSPHDIGWILPEYSRHTHGIARELSPGFLFCKTVRLPDDEHLWDGDWQWAVYTIDDPDQALAMAARGADLIETNAIGEMLHHPVFKRSGCGGEF